MKTSAVWVLVAMTLACAGRPARAYEPDALDAQMRAGRVPTVPDADALFRTLVQSKSGSVEHVHNALLVCRAQIINGRWDELAGPDLRFRFQFGNRPPVTVWGPDNASSMLISIPAVSLDRGDRVRVMAWDRDLWIDERIAAAEVRYRGDRHPLQLEGERAGASQFTLYCELMPEAAVRARAQPWLDALDRALAGPAKGRSLVDTFTAVAAFLGWRHPLIQLRVARTRSAPAW